MDKLIKRAANLISVKSFVTIALTCVFCYLAIVGPISQEFMLIYTTVIAFYFGTQSQKAQDAIEVKGNAEQP